MLDRKRLQKALGAVLAAHSSESAPLVKFATQLNAAQQVLQQKPTAFSCFGIECVWQKQAS